MCQSASLVNNVTGWRYITNVKVDRWLSLVFFPEFFFYVVNTSFFFHWHLFFYFISNNNCRLLTINIVFFIIGNLNHIRIIAPYFHYMIMSFKLGHVSIPKRRIFLPLFLFCAYDSSVLQNFKIFTHLLPNFSYTDDGSDVPLH